MLMNFLRFFVICAWAIGIIGGMISAGIVGNWGIMICLLASIGMGFDKAREYVDIMMK